MLSNSTHLCRFYFGGLVRYHHFLSFLHASDVFHWHLAPLPGWVSRKCAACSGMAPSRPAPLCQLQCAGSAALLVHNDDDSALFVPCFHIAMSFGNVF